MRTLAESDSEEDAVAWVMKSRKIEQEKAEAEKRVCDSVALSVS